MFRDIALNYPTDKFNGHSYLELYNELMTPRKNTAKNILEIGIQNGASMQLWNDYFLQARIYGVDIIPLPPNFIVTERMTHYLDNAYTTDFIQQNFINKQIIFDILVDDGPHTLESMLFFARHYSNLISPGGIMIIEDIPTIDWIVQIIHSFPSQLQSKTRIVDNRHINNRWDDILVVLQA